MTEHATNERERRRRDDHARRQRWTRERLGELDGLPQAGRRRVETAIVLQHLDVVDGIVRRLASGYRDEHDLRQVGYIGLVQAVRRFDATRGENFLAFAVPTISGEIKKYLRDCGWFIRPPRRIQELAVDAAAAIPDLAQRLGREPSIADVAAYLQAEPSAVAEAIGARATFRPASLDAGTDEDEERSLGALVGHADARLERADLRMSLRIALAKLTPRERRIVYLRFIEERTQREIASDIGVTQMQVSRLLTAILRRLHDLLEDGTETAAVRAAPVVRAVPPVRAAPAMRSAPAVRPMPAALSA